MKTYRLRAVAKGKNVMLKEDDSRQINNKIKNRNSSFEILRIISMILIITHHYSIHGGFDAITYDNLSINQFFLQILLFGGKIGCYLFMFITGYFMICRRMNYKKVFILFLELEFYSLVIFLIFNLGMGRHYSKKDWIRNIFPIIYGNWFVVNYIMLYFLLPFINKLVLHLSKKELKIMILSIIIIYSIIPSICYYITQYQWSFSNFDFMIVSYIIGAYIRINGFSKFDKKRTCVKTILFSFSILIFWVIFMDSLAYILKNNSYIWMATVTRAPTSFLLLMIAIATFYIFKNNSFNSKIINFIAPSMLGVYLIHDNDLIKPWIWKELFPNNNYLYSNYLVVHFGVKVFAVFIISLVIDLLRRYIIEKPCKQLIDLMYVIIKLGVKRIWVCLDRFFS